ncbi:unnamed protein product [Enterobius vermicularis]|uniref:ING domain-containing protein n=1 Tax=Enterobius vermicularis TaxID=51028 RepID=A0A0N4VNA3_ENTVE|nr:unnamed protein product [Enterobius vermicularis]
MLYLEDFLELIEHLPNELRERCTDLRMLDLKVQSGLDQINKAVKEYFEQSPGLSREEQERRFSKIKEVCF